MQQCAKTCVKKCKRAKNSKIDFADFCIFCVPQLSLGVTLDTPQKEFILIFNYLYLQMVTSASESRFCVGK